jgi:hypothetical protein
MKLVFVFIVTIGYAASLVVESFYNPDYKGEFSIVRPLRKHRISSWPRFKTYNDIWDLKQNEYLSNEEQLKKRIEEEKVRKIINEHLMPLTRGNSFMRDFYSGRY